jgi:hypothetical protein
VEGARREVESMKRIIVSIPDDVYYALLKRQNVTGASVSAQARLILQKALGLERPEVIIPKGVQMKREKSA